MMCILHHVRYVRSHLLICSRVANTLSVREKAITVPLPHLSQAGSFRHLPHPQCLPVSRFPGFGGPTPPISRKPTILIAIGIILIGFSKTSVSIPSREFAKDAYPED